MPSIELVEYLGMFEFRKYALVTVVAAVALLSVAAHQKFHVQPYLLESFFISFLGVILLSGIWEKTYSALSNKAQNRIWNSISLQGLKLLLQIPCFLGIFLIASLNLNPFNLALFEDHVSSVCVKKFFAKDCMRLFEEAITDKEANINKMSDHTKELVIESVSSVIKNNLDHSTHLPNELKTAIEFRLRAVHEGISNKNFKASIQALGTIGVTSFPELYVPLSGQPMPKTN